MIDREAAIRAIEAEADRWVAFYQDRDARRGVFSESYEINRVAGLRQAAAIIRALPDAPGPPTASPRGHAITPFDMTAHVNRLAEIAIRRDHAEAEAFLRENGADPDIHELVIYPSPVDPRWNPENGIDFRCSSVHVLIPRADLDGTGRYPSRDEAVVKYPSRTI